MEDYDLSVWFDLCKLFNDDYDILARAYKTFVNNKEKQKTLLNKLNNIEEYPELYNECLILLDDIPMKVLQSYTIVQDYLKKGSVRKRKHK